MESSYGENFKDKSKKDFISKQEYKEFKKTYKIDKKQFESTKEKYDIVNMYIENYKKIDPDGFNIVNTLKDAVTGANYDVVLRVDYSSSLVDWGGAKTEQRKNGKGVYYSITTVSRNFNATDDHLAHEFGHSVTIAKKPSYWLVNTNSRLNCQENPNEEQTRTAIEWQNRWNNKCKQYFSR